MAPASVQVVCMEPVVFLRGQSAVGEDARGRRRQIDFDAPPSQLRGLVTLTLPRASRVKEITVTLQGKARTDWPEGIGPNRLDTVDESVIFRQKVTLYSARESAPARRPRASSIGPGINWANDDLAWPSPGAASGSRVSTANGTSGSSAGGGQASNGERISPSGSASEGRRGAGGAEASKSPKIARSITKTAAKAGAAILPPTLMRDLQGGGGGSSSSSSGGSNGVAKHAAQTSPTLHRPTSGGGTQSAPRSPLSMFVASSSSSLPDPSQESYFDPPPNYGGNTSASSEQLSPPLQQSLSSSAGASARHPQSISAAGPGQRSILHVTSTSQRQASEQRARLNTKDSPNSGSTLSTAGHGVRFDPQAVNNAFEREGVSPSSSSSTTTAAATNRLSLQLPNQANNVVGNGSPSDPNAAPVRSEPNSRRVSVDQAAAKIKGKVTSASHSPTSTPSVPTEKGARRGIKNLLGGSRRTKDEDGERKALRSNTGGGGDYGHHVQTMTSVSPQSAAPSQFNSGEEEWREFPKGTHSYPFSIPLPSNLPPTLHADFGSNAYTLRAHVHRAGPLTANLTSETEVTLVHAPNEDGQDDIETIVVERNWEDALRYMIVVMGKSFPVGGRIPIWAKFVPMEKVRIHRILATLEERTAYYAKGRKVARHEVPRRWTLLKVQPPATTSTTNTGAHQGILPILSDAPDAILQSPLAPMARSAALSYSADASQDREVIEATALASLGDPTGPWELAMDLEVPKTSSTRINISSNHNKSNIAVVHVVKVAIRVERLDSYKGVDPSAMADGDRQLFDILIEAPVAINHSHTANAWLTLPDYWSVPALDQEAGGGGGGSQESRSNMTSTSSSNGGIRIGNKVIAQSSPTTIAAKGKSTASSTSGGSDAAARSAARLAQLGRQWLSLTGASSSSSSNGVQRTTQQQGTRTGSNVAASAAEATFTPQSAGQAMVTYAGNYGEQDFNDDHGLPTYAMIDSARGSVDPPPGRHTTTTTTTTTTTKRR